MKQPNKPHHESWKDKVFSLIIKDAPHLKYNVVDALAEDFKELISQTRKEAVREVLERVRNDFNNKYLSQIKSFESITPVEIDQIISSIEDEYEQK